MTELLKQMAALTSTVQGLRDSNASQKAKLDRLESSVRRNPGTPSGEDSDAEGEPCFKCGTAWAPGQGLSRKGQEQEER